jgi:hypothetical protein
VTRPDLADRSLFLALESIPEEQCRPEAELWAAFELAHPHILGALLDAVSVGLKNLPNTQLRKHPRMADFALWMTACESALWPAGTFMAAYNANRAEAVLSVIEADSVAMAVRAMMAPRTKWTGTATALLSVLTGEVDERTTKARNWPESPGALGGRLRRMAASLRRIGIQIRFERKGHAGTRKIYITTTPADFSSDNADWVGNSASAPSAPSASTQRSGEADSTDGADGKKHTQSGASEKKYDRGMDLDDWAASQWRAYFDKCVATAEFDQGLPTEEAEARAHEYCIVEWLNQNFERSPPGHCLACRDADSAHDPLLPYGSEPTGHAWLHSRCWPAWHVRRKAEAVAALKAMGITQSAGFPDDVGKNGNA